MNAIINATSELKPYLNTHVGYVKINKPWVHHNNNYECAAWWEDSEIKPGVYNLILKESHYAPKELMLVASLDAIVVDDYFPALWGGLPISRKDYTPRNVGQHRKVNRRFEIVDSIEATGYSPTCEINIFVNPLIWQTFIDAARATMQDYSNLLAKYQEDYRNNGDGDYDTNLSMITHCTDNMSKLANAITKMKTRIKYMDEATEYMRNLHFNNTSWINEAA